MTRADEGRRIREITSRANPLLKVFRGALATGVTREGWLAAEGPLLLEEALKSGSTGRGRISASGAVRSVIVARGAADKFAGLLESLPADTELTQVPDSLFQTLAQTASPQGIAALVEVQPPEFDAVIRQANVLMAVICGLQDPGNLGTILRAAEAFGADAVITLKSTVSPFNPKVVRACGGAIFRLPLFIGIEAGRLLARLHEKKIQIIAMDRRSPPPLSAADLRGSLAFLIGNEAAGLPGKMIQSADLTLSIPIRPGVDSINAAMAAGIFLYEAARQRRSRYPVIPSEARSLALQ
ncbi:MAG TPA: RNA methyltransferase [Terriglobia bacterium]|nr:RNA methyltransferase [Terriglobia bacterium]